jgi:hypothetical protein
MKTNKLTYLDSYLRCFIRKYGVDKVSTYKPSKQSTLPVPISEYLDCQNIQYSLDTKLSQKDIRRPDIYIPSANLVIECDGLFWHSDAPPENKRLEKEYHVKKYKFYQSRNLKSLFFRSDEIIYRLDIVNSIISYHLWLSTNISSKRCGVIKLSKEIANKFFLDNYLEEETNKNKKNPAFALIHQNEIVAAIRVTNKSEGLKVDRFCNKKYTTVIGGLSKLLKEVTRIYNPKRIIGFVDLRYEDGHSLEQLGFIKESEHLSFKWTNCKQTLHRMTFKGSLGYSQGYYKIWDCGQAKYVLNLS